MCSIENPKKLQKPKYTNLEMANQMFKDAWLVKHTFFQKKFPNLTTEEVNKMTAQYFANLKDD